MSEQIYHLRTLFQPQGREMDVVSFALGILKQQRLEVFRKGMPVSSFKLGDAASPLDVGLQTQINAAPLATLGWQGRWIVNCPNPDCMGAEYLDPENLIFMCCSCWNEEHGHSWLKVQIPTGSRKEIERLLILRPGRNRNWIPGESVASLRSDNIAHGVGV